MAIYYKFDLRSIESISNSTFKKTIAFEYNGGVKLYNLTTKISSNEREKIQRYLKKLPLVGYKLNNEDIKELEVLIDENAKDIPFLFSFHHPCNLFLIILPYYFMNKKKYTKSD